jgi:hypothetical protein
MDDGIARRRRERGETMPTDTGGKRNGGIGALWRRLPMFVRELTVGGSLIAAGFVARDRIGLLQAERVMYKAMVDTTVAKVGNLEKQVGSWLPFARYSICSTERQAVGRSNEGCERTLIGTSLWAVFLEERGR